MNLLYRLICRLHIPGHTVSDTLSDDRSYPYAILLRSELVDFELARGRLSEMRTRSVQCSAITSGVEPLLKWIFDYFSEDNTRSKTATVSEALLGARAIVMTDRMPIILQHKGHSRTIVGCEQQKGGLINLLTFDPSGRY